MAAPRRRAPNEKVQAYRRRVHAIEGHQLRERLAAWCEAVLDTVTDAWPKMPEGIEDRDADVWEALLAVADDGRVISLGRPVRPPMSAVWS